MGSINLINGGLDVLSIVDSLIEVERTPITRLQQNAESFQDRIAAYRTFNTKLLALKTCVGSLLFHGEDVPLNMPAGYDDRFSASLFALRKATSSDEAVVVATAGKGPTTGNFSVTVSRLAKSNAYASNNFASSTAVQTQTGSLVIQDGAGDPVTIAIDSSNNTLEGIKCAINAAGAGCSATILNDGSAQPYRLVITSDGSGTANALTITNNLTEGAGAAVSLAESVAAQDAALTINGVDITSSSNTVTGAVEGVTFLLRSESGSATVQIDHDTDAIAAGIQDLITKYNDVVSYITSQSRYNSATRSAGILSGDFTLRQAQMELVTTITQSIESGYESVKVLAQAGITLSNSGLLSLDESELREQLASNFDATAHLLLSDALDAAGNTVSLAPLLHQRLANLTDSIEGPIHRATDAIEKNIQRINEQVEQMELRLEARRELLTAQYARADEALRQLTVLQSSMSSLMNSLESS